MSGNVEPTDTIIAMVQSGSSSTTPVTITTIDMQQSVDSRSEPLHYYKRTTSRQTSYSNSSAPPTPLSSASELFKPVQLDIEIPENDEQPSSPSFSTMVSVTDIQQSINPPAKPVNIVQRMLSRLSSLSFSPMPQSAPVNDDYSLKKFNFPVHSMSRRQIAEIQLHALLNDKEESLPTFLPRMGAMSLEEVAKQLNTPLFIIERLLKVINSLCDSSNLPVMSQTNVVKLTRALNSTIDVRALIFFMMLDEDDDKLVTRNELSQFLERYLKSMSLDANRLQAIIEILLQRFHLETKTQIDFEEFHSIVIEDSTILESFSRFTVHPAWFERSVSSHPPPNVVQRFGANFCCDGIFYKKYKSNLTAEYLNNNLSRIVMLILYILVNLALLLYVVIYRLTVVKSNVFVVFARIGGILLNFNCSLIVVLMLKQTVLLIRSNRLLRRLIPVDGHIDYHKFVGRFIAVLAILHTIAHMINFGRLHEYSWPIFMSTTTPGIGWVGGFTPLSGLILCIVLATMVICSMERIRRKGYFQVFYWTHTLYIVFFVFLIVHAKDFWKWAIGPLLWFFLEKFYSYLTRYSLHSGRTYLHSATIEQSNVISLNIHRPKNFAFRPGDYININLPRVALYEFHPFTISSAPEETDILRVHIQASGNWTKRVYQRFKDMSQNNGDQEDYIKVHRADLNPESAVAEERIDRVVIADENERNQSDINNAAMAKTKKEIVIINGPYSSCARYIFDCEHVVLIGGGIGVTPYASILSSLMAQFRASRSMCQHCQHVNYDRKILVENRRLKQVDFIWVSRDQKSFEWFLKLLRQFEQEQEAYLTSNPDEHRFLTIHLYFTGMKDDKFVGHHTLELVTQLWAQVGGEDIFTGLKARTHIDRPVWDKIFTELNSAKNKSNTNDVDVFFCGPPTMGKAIQECCTKHHFHFHEEKF